MKKLLIIPLVVVLIAVGYHIYINYKPTYQRVNHHGLSFEVPKHYNISNNKEGVIYHNNQGYTVAIGRTGYIDVSVSEFMELTEQVMTLGSLTLNGYIKTFSEYFTKSNVVSSEVLLINDYEVGKVAVQYDSNDLMKSVNKTEEVYFILRDKRIIILAISMPTKDTNKYNHITDRIINSIRYSVYD